MTPIAAIEVPEVFARNHSQADFYRRGWRDAQTGNEPATMRGYPAALALAYAAGGMDAMAEAA